MQLNLRSVKYLGQIFSEEGTKMNPDRVTAIEKMECPKCKKDLQRILGVVNYLRLFIDNFAEKTESLRNLMKKM